MSLTIEDMFQRLSPVNLAGTEIQATSHHDGVRALPTLLMCGIRPMFTCSLFRLPCRQEFVEMVLSNDVMLAMALRNDLLVSLP